MAIRPVHSSGCPHPHARKEKEREWHSVKGSVMPVGRIIAMLGRVVGMFVVSYRTSWGCIYMWKYV